MMKLFSPKEVADVIGVSPQWIRKLLLDGKLRGEKVGKNWVIREGIVNTFLKSRIKTSKAK